MEDDFTFDPSFHLFFTAMNEDLTPVPVPTPVPQRDMGAWLWVALIVGLLLYRGGCSTAGGAAAPFAVPPGQEGHPYALFIEDVDNAQALTAGQRLALESTRTGGVKDFIKNTAKGDSRTLDKKNADLSREDAWWQAAFKAGMATNPTMFPLMVVSNGRSGFIGPVPATADDVDTLNIVKKFAQ